MSNTRCDVLECYSFSDDDEFLLDPATVIYWIRSGLASVLSETERTGGGQVGARPDALNFKSFMCWGQKSWLVSVVDP